MTDLNENTSDLSENLSENAPFDEVTEVSNTDTQEPSSVEAVSESDAEIDAINSVMAEENDSEVIAENTTTDEPVGNNDRLESETGTVAENETVELSGNSEQLEPQPNPWDDAPKDVYFYEKTYEDGHLGSYTESAETAYKFGWDIEHNYILIADTEKSDVNGWTYPKDLCPHKSERDKQIELWNREIFELKEELQRTDYKAIKYAEGVLTDEDYQPTGIQRQAWRKRINELERLIAG